MSNQEIPIIVYDDWGQAQEIAAKAINLLRSGHPAVQVIINTPEKFQGPETQCEYMRRRLSDAVEALSILIDRETPEIKQNEIYGIRPSFKTGPKRGSSGNINYVFLIYRA